MKNILVTGGLGFIGSCFVPYLLEQDENIKVINLDNKTYASDEKNLEQLVGHHRYQFIKGDICDRALLEKIFEEYQVQSVIHFAAESHVDNSITGPAAFINTNIVGTFMLLDVARQYWMSAPSTYHKEFENSRFHHISTDEVYGTLGKEGLFLETTPYAPNSPYSASKASSDMLIRSFFHTYGMNVVTTNCSNNYGPRQHDEKLIPTIIRNAIQDNPIPIYGDGMNIRDWLYVLDHCKGIWLAYQSGVAGETYNIGGHNEVNNLEVAHTICKTLDVLHPKKDKTSYLEQISFVTDRPGHDQRYAIDSSKIQRDLGWKADENFKTGIQKTIQWYLKKYLG